MKEINEMYQVILNDGLNLATPNLQRAVERAKELQDVYEHTNVKIIFPEVKK